MAGMGFVDCWEKVGKPEPVSTCRFSTHIDYVFVNKEVLQIWDCTEVIHHPSNASDHKPVFATFKISKIRQSEN